MADATVLTAGDLTIDRARRRVMRGENAIDLPKLSFEFLLALVDAAPAVLSHDELAARVWHGRIVSPETIAQRARMLRVSLEDSVDAPRYVAAVRGIGYRWLPEIDGPAEPPNGDAPVEARPRMRRYAVAAAVATVVIATASLWSLNAGQQTGHDVAAIRNAIDHDEIGTAFALAADVERHSEPLPADIWREVAATISIESSPSEAEVEYRDYDRPNDRWVSLGTTPVDNAQLPRDLVLLRLSKPGYATVEHLTHVPLDYIGDRALSESGNTLRIEMQSKADVPPGMVFVPASPKPVRWSSYFTDAVTLPAYFIDRHETTNRDYQKFVDAGGYADPRYWTDLEFVDGERHLDWRAAVARFTDATGRAGPANWQLGRYPMGEADLPVTGVSWFEAAAYARFHGRSLPTVYHWARALGDASTYDVPARVTRRANFSGKLEPVGARDSIGIYGADDLAGNAAEWVANARYGKRVLAGGAAADPPYVLCTVDAAPWQRSATSGFRTVFDLESPPAMAFADISGFDVPPAAQAMPDEQFDAAMASYAYPSFSADARVAEERRLDSNRMLRVSLRNGRGEARFDVYVFTRDGTSPPYQAVLYSGGDYGMQYGARLEDWLDFDMKAFAPVLNSGRAVIYPTWSGTFARYDGIREADPRDRVGLWYERNRGWVRDTMAVLDFIDASPEFDGTIAWLGLSWGAIASFADVYHFRDRFGAAVLLSGGHTLSDPWQRTLFGRLELPVLMLNGRYDGVLPPGAPQRLFDALGTPPSSKRLVLYDTGHWPLPRNQMAREMADWLDRYLGPVPKSQTTQRPLTTESRGGDEQS